VRPRSPRSSLSPTTLPASPSSASSSSASSSSASPSPSSVQTTSGRTTTTAGSKPTTKPAAGKPYPSVRGSTVRPRQLLSDPPKKGGAEPARSQSTSAPSTAGARRLPSVHSPGANLPDPSLPKDTQATSASDTTVPKRNWFPSETTSKASQRVTAASPQIAPSPQARPNAGASWSNEPEPPIQSEAPLPNLVGPGPMRLGQRAAPRSPALPAPARAPVDAGEPYPALSGRPQDPVGTPFLDQKPMTPRPPRARLGPEEGKLPLRRSRRARHPLVIIGNACLTLLLLVVLAGGVAFAVGKTRFEAPGPLEREKVVSIPPRSGVRDIADLLR